MGRGNFLKRNGINTAVEKCVDRIGKCFREEKWPFGRVSLWRGSRGAPFFIEANEFLRYAAGHRHLDTLVIFRCVGNHRPFLSGDFRSTVRAAIQQKVDVAVFAKTEHKVHPRWENQNSAHHKHEQRCNCPSFSSQKAHCFRVTSRFSCYMRHPRLQQVPRAIVISSTIAL